MNIKHIERGNGMIEKKTIPVSSKRQITIPQKYCKALKIESEVECIYNGRELIIRPKSYETGYFAQEILNELIDKGYSGEGLKKEFARLNKSVRTGVKAIIEDAKKYANEQMKNYKDKTDEIFDSED